MNSEYCDNALPSSDQAGRQSQYPNIKSLLATSLVIGSMILTGCNIGNQDSATESVATTEDSNQSDNNEATTPPDSQASDKGDKAPSTVEGDAAGAAGSPVRYNVGAWGKEPVEAIKIDELDKIQAAFGKVVTTDQNSLDYASNPATKYRFMADDEPYLDIIDSQKYLELGWYYANPTDSEEEKKTSTAHAKKAYKFARQLMGDDGAKIVTDMLGGQVVKNKTAGDQKVELAKCEFYSCMLVLAKPAA